MNKNMMFAVLILVLPVNVYADDYPTIESVRYVLQCMQELGMQSEENLYACSCRHDYISSQMPYEQYEQATFFVRYAEMPGKRGGLVRDNAEAPKLKKQLTTVKTEAAARCPVVKHIEAGAKPVEE